MLLAFIHTHTHTYNVNAAKNTWHFETNKQQKYETFMSNFESSSFVNQVKMIINSFILIEKNWLINQSILLIKKWQKMLFDYLPGDGLIFFSDDNNGDCSQR